MSSTMVTLLVRGVVLDAAPELLRARVHEAACALGSARLDVTFSARDEDTLLGLVGRQATLLSLGPSARAVHGLITRLALTERRRRLDGQPGLGARLTLEPQLSRLRERRGYRVFSDRSAIDVVTELLGEHRVPHRLRLVGPHPKREHTVQRDESDLELVLRLLSEQGVAHFVEHPLEEGAHDRTGVGASDVVVLCDHAPYYPPIVGDPTLLYRPSGPGTALSRDERHVTSARVAVATAPRSALVRGYDFRRPRLELRSEARAAESPDASGRAAGRAAVDLYHFGGVGDESPPDVELATAELERARRGSLTLRATSRCFRLTPGRTFTLGDAPTAAASGPWVVTRVTHRLDPSSADAPYECRVSAEPAERTLRPPRRARRVAPSSETAIVVGPPGQEVHVDELGRVRVQFLWQLDGAWDGRASAWLRTAQAWAGTGFGSQFLPRVGMEVLVHYLGGDVDRPVIAGALYNATHPPPFPVSTSAVKSGLRTLSSPGGAGYSELSFEDRAGAELVQLVAQRDRATLVRHDHRERVEHDQASEVAHDRTARVGRDDVVEVGRHHEVRVAGSETGASMRAGSIQQSTGGASMGMTRDVRLSAAGDMSLGAGGTLSLGGALVTITSRGDVLIEASGNIGLRAGGDVRIEAGGDVSLEGSEIIERGSAIREN